MDVYVIPAGPDRYELYCEQPFTSAADPAAVPASGLIGRARQWFEALLRSAEQWGTDESRVAPTGWLARLHDAGMAWVAERVAEQRLLWNLRRETTVTAVYPDDLSEDQVHAIIRRTLQNDCDRHQYWVWVDGALFVVTFVALGPLFLLIPGVANLPALYFGFRTVGHWYSKGGAQHGLRSVRWVGRAVPVLTELRQVSVLPPEARDERLADISSRLHLVNLSSFYDRVSRASL